MPQPGSAGRHAPPASPGELTLKLDRRQMARTTQSKENPMVDALIIDACRTPRGIGKAGKGALSGIHPQQVRAAVLPCLAGWTGIDTASVRGGNWGTSFRDGPS